MSLKFLLEYLGSGRASIQVYPELLTVYHPHIGSEGVVLWLLLAFSAISHQTVDPEELARKSSLDPHLFDEAFAKLLQFELVKVAAAGDGSQKVMVQDPLGEEEFTQLFPQETAAAVEVDSKLSEDIFGELLQYYESKVGWITPKICDDLAGWVDDGLEPAVIKEAINEMMKNAESPRYAYLNAILVSWHRNGWHSADDLKKEREKKKPQKAGMDGVPNAAAYRDLTPEDLELIRKWEELNPDEYTT